MPPDQICKNPTPGLLFSTILSGGLGGEASPTTEEEGTSPDDETKALRVSAHFQSRPDSHPASVEEPRPGTAQELLGQRTPDLRPVTHRPALFPGNRG